MFRMFRMKSLVVHGENIMMFSLILAILSVLAILLRFRVT